MVPTARPTSSVTCMQELSAQRKVISFEEAKEIAHRIYGLDGEITRFATEKDDTFRIDLSSGQRYVLKIAHPSERREELDFQVTLLRHLATCAPHLPIPRIFADRDGRHLPSIETRSSEMRVIRLMSFIPGTPLDRAASSPDLRRRIGELLAHLRHAMADFAHPADSRTVAWDVKNVLGLAELMRFVESRDHRIWIERSLALFEDMEPRLRASRHQVLHNDFNASNLVVAADDPHRVSGVIDFGDAVRTAIAIDVSTALMNQMPKSIGSDRIDLFDEARDVLAGYLRYADLTEEEMQLVPFLAYARQATRALLSSWRAQLFPENAPYVLRHTEPGWLHLKWFYSLSTEQIGDLLLSATCQYRNPAT